MESMCARDIKRIVEDIFNKCTGRYINWSKSIDVLSEINSFEFISLIVEIENTLNIEFDDERLLIESYSDTDCFLKYILYKLSLKHD